MNVFTKIETTNAPAAIGPYSQGFIANGTLYASGQIHIDTQGYRTWGPDLSRYSSMCNY